LSRTRLYLDIQRASTSTQLPAERSLRRWARLALGEDAGSVSLVLRLVDEAEIRALNRDFRGCDRPTNVLSFPFEAPPGVASRLLGDLVLCAPVIESEARAQGKSSQAHWAHMVVHGVLHLLGYDHRDDREALAMEARERHLLATLGFPDPYVIEANS
jgi:probable rRNA maturation factor